MKLTLKPVALAVLVATTPFAGVAYGQAQKAPAAPLVKPAPAPTKALIATDAPADWIIYEDTTYMPVVDPVSRHLYAARKAFDAKDNKTAATDLRAVAQELDALSKQATRVSKSGTKAEVRLAQDSAKRIERASRKVNAAATALEAGKITTRAELDKAIDKGTRADMERRWLLADVTTRYPLSDEPQRHFAGAVAAFGSKDYKAAAIDIRKATGYMRLESARATGEARHELDRSVVQLDRLATSVEKGAVKDEKTMDKVFANANHALALEHRANAAESWARKEYDQAGYELKAAAKGLESGAGWVSAQAKAGASATVAETDALGDKLASGATWTRDEVAKDFASLGNSIDALGQKTGSSGKAPPVKVGAAGRT
jgi:hypothetical protein